MAVFSARPVVAIAIAVAVASSLLTSPKGVLAQPPPTPTDCGPNGNLDLVIVPPAIVEAHGAACLDGSAPVYYVRVRNASSGQWLVALEGGAWCWQLDEDPSNPMASCPDRSTSYLGVGGGSPLLPPNTSVCEQGVLAPDADTNPHFGGFNIAYIHYCDGSFFTSMNPSPVPATLSNGTAITLTFRGKANVAAVLDDLIATYGLGTSPTNSGDARVLLTGASAGGQGTYFHAAWIANDILTPARFPGMRFGVLADAGYFLDAPDYATGQHQYRGRLATAGPLWQSLEQRTLDSACLLAYPPPDTSCFFPQYSAPFASFPLFVLNSANDAEQLYDDLQVGCCPLVDCSHVSPHPGPACNASQMASIVAYRELFLGAVNATLQGRPGTGSFIDSCYVHVQGWSAGGWVNYTLPTGTGTPGSRIAMRDAFAAWWDEVVDGGGQWSPVQLVDPATFGENPSCPYPPPPPSAAHR
jgi:hypothetical protein